MSGECTSECVRNAYTDRGAQLRQGLLRKHNQASELRNLHTAQPSMVMGSSICRARVVHQLIICSPAHNNHLTAHLQP